MAVQLPRNGVADVTFLHPDCRAGALFKASVTLGTTSQVATFTLPDDAIGFRLRPTTTDVYFAINEDPSTLTAITNAAGTVTVSASVAAGGFGAGGVAKADAWEVRLLEHVKQTGIGTGRTLRLRPATNSSVVVIEVF